MNDAVIEQAIDDVDMSGYNARITRDLFYANDTIEGLFSSADFTPYATKGEEGIFYVDENMFVRSDQTEFYPPEEFVEKI